MIDMNQAIVHRDVNLERPGYFGDRITVMLPLRASCEVDPFLNAENLKDVVRKTVIEELKRRIWSDAYGEFIGLSKDMLHRIAMWHPRGAEKDYSDLKDRLQELLDKAP